MFALRRIPEAERNIDEPCVRPQKLEARIPWTIAGSQFNVTRMINKTATIAITGIIPAIRKNRLFFLLYILPLKR